MCASFELMCCLCFLADDYDKVFSTCIGMLPELWVLSMAHCKQLDDIKVTNPNIALPKLHKALFE